ncbi:MAG: thioredoxin family protein [Chloroflexi bacterium]|nr:thioredoxin family protein [Chloroflexota bacterium]
MPVIDPERFEQGLPLAVWAREKQDAHHQQQMEAVATSTTLAAEDEAFFRSLPRPVRLLVINEECGSSTQCVGVLKKVVAVAGEEKLRVRIFERREAPDLMQRYRKEGRYEAVPVFIALDEQLNEAAVMYEHPPSLDRLIAEHRQEFFRRHQLSEERSLGDLPLEVQRAWVADYRQLRDQRQDWINQQVVSEVRRLVEAALGQDATVSRTA